MYRLHETILKARYFLEDLCADPRCFCPDGKCILETWNPGLITTVLIPIIHLHAHKGQGCALTDPHHLLSLGHQRWWWGDNPLTQKHRAQLLLIISCLLTITAHRSTEHTCSHWLTHSANEHVWHGSNPCVWFAKAKAIRGKQWYYLMACRTVSRKGKALLFHGGHKKVLLETCISSQHPSIWSPMQMIHTDPGTLLKWGWGWVGGLRVENMASNWLLWLKTREYPTESSMIG